MANIKTFVTVTIVYFSSKQSYMHACILDLKILYIILAEVRDMSAVTTSTVTMKFSHLIYCVIILSFLMLGNVRTLSKYGLNDHEDIRCPLWHVPSSTGECECGDSLNGVVTCEGGYIYIKHGYCMTWNNQTNSEELQRCLLSQWDKSNNTCTEMDHHFNTYTISIDVSGNELNQLMCKAFNRQGTRCSQCLENYGPAVFTDSIYCADCSKYRHFWILQTLFQLLLSTLMCLLFTLFEIKGTSSPMNIIILYAQIGTLGFEISSVMKNALLCFVGKRMAYALLTVIGVWNLDFLNVAFPHLCIDPSFKAINILLFYYIIALSPLVLSVVIYTLIQLYDRNFRLVVIVCLPITKCFSKCSDSWNPKRKILNTFATFFLLSYTKLLFVSIEFLLVVYSYNSKGEQVSDSGVLLLDPSVKSFHSQHIPYVVLALIILVVFILLPPLFLLLYPKRIFRKLLASLGFQQWTLLFLNQLMDIFQGWYKDGTGGTRDFRSFSALYLMLRIGLGFGFVLVILQDYRDDFVMKEVILLGVIHILLGALFLTLKPYKKVWMNHFDGIIFLCVGTTWILGFSYDTNVYDLGGAIIILVMTFTILYVACCKCKDKYNC